MKKYLSQDEVTHLSYEIVGCAIKVHKTLGPGLLESVYQECLKYELEKVGFNVVQQMSVPIQYGDIQMDAKLRLDLLVEDTVIIEIKAVEYLLPVHKAQLLTYMKLLEKPQGLLINFHVENISKHIIPFVNEHFRILKKQL